MDPRALVEAVLAGEDLTARQLVKDARREGYCWADAPRLQFDDPRATVVYAALVALFSVRQGQKPPAWTRMGRLPEPLFSVRRTRESRRYRELVERRTPDVLREHNVFATEDYLSVP